MRVLNHPILGELEVGKTVEIEVDGATIEAIEDEPISSALAAAGKSVFRHTQKRGEPRGVFCAIGRCTDCMMVVDGVPNVRTCVTPVRAGMVVETQEGLGESRQRRRSATADAAIGSRTEAENPPEERQSIPRNTELAIVGAGPAGLSAAIEAAQAGVHVTLIDENQKAGGQLFKQIHKFFGSEAHHAGTRGIDIGHMLLREVEQSGVNVLLDSVVWGVFDGNTLGIIREDRSFVLDAQRILLATGALENAITFPGWTLPGVMGAGAIQTVVNVNRVLPGERVLMVGSGNVGLIVSYQLLQAGAEVAAIVEAAPAIGGYAVHASKVRRNGVPILTSTTVKEARGESRVESVVLAQVDDNWQPVAGSERELEVDTVCLACGLSPLSELAWMAGCEFAYLPELGGHVPVHNEDLETTVPGLYVAGDLAGVEEASTAIEEGRLAGIAAAESLGYLRPEEAAARKQATRTRLEDLRGGPFGAARKAAVSRIEQGRLKSWRY